AALTLRDDLELHRRLVERGIPLLELAQRRPLRLADGLARRLDRQVGVGAHLRLVRFFFLRRTWRGALACGFGRSGAGGSTAAPLPLVPSSSFGGVRDVRRSTVGAAVFGISRRVIRPWPTVHRLVVTQ